MRFKSQSFPLPSEGMRTTTGKQVQPNQAMSLETILERFTRNEPVAVGKDMQYHESDDDLEKVRNMDLVDREEYINKLKSTQNDFEKQEKEKEKAARKAANDKILEEEKAKLAKQKKEGGEPDPAK